MHVSKSKYDGIFSHEYVSVCVLFLISHTFSPFSYQLLYFSFLVYPFWEGVAVLNDCVWTCPSSSPFLAVDCALSLADLLCSEKVTRHWSCFCSLSFFVACFSKMFPWSSLCQLLFSHVRMSGNAYIALWWSFRIRLRQENDLASIK